MYLPYIFRSFQGFKTKDVKESHSKLLGVLVFDTDVLGFCEEIKGVVSAFATNSRAFNSAKRGP